jgi:hypothetical protein
MSQSNEYCKGCKKVKGEDMSDNPVKLYAQIKEFNRVHEFMNDENLDRAMEIVVKLITNQGHIPAIKAVPLIVELQALSTKFAVAHSTYKTFDAGPARSESAHKRDVYYSMRDALNKLVDALKISAKYGLEN